MCDDSLDSEFLRCREAQRRVASSTEEMGASPGVVTPEPSLEGHTGVNQGAPLGEGVSERERSRTQDPGLRPKTKDPGPVLAAGTAGRTSALRPGVGSSLGLTFST